MKKTRYVQPMCMKRKNRASEAYCTNNTMAMATRESIQTRVCWCMDSRRRYILLQLRRLDPSQYILVATRFVTNSDVVFCCLLCMNSQGKHTSQVGLHSYCSLPRRTITIENYTNNQQRRNVFLCLEGLNGWRP